MSQVLVVQPDHSQAQTLRDIFRRVAADLEVVHSTGEAMDAIAFRMPDLILLSTLLSPRDEDVLMAHLRTLEGASHLQTLTLPQFRSAEEPVARKSRFGFGKKPKAPAPVGCDPVVFAEEVVAHLQRASERRNRAAAPKPPTPDVAVAPSTEPVAAVEPAWGTPVTAWGADNEQAALNTAFESFVFAGPAAPEPGAPFVETPSEPFAGDDAFVEEPIVADTPPAFAEQLTVVAEEPARVVEEEPAVLAEPAFTEEAAFNPLTSSTALTEYDEVDRLARELGLDVGLMEIRDAAAGDAGDGGDAADFGHAIQLDEVSQFDEAFDFSAALDRARVEAEQRRSMELAQAELAEAQREAALAEARATAERDARAAVAADLARVQAEAEAMREAAVAEARATAQREARETLAADLARVQAEAEAMREIAIAEARSAAGREARETLDVEIARVRSETETTIADALSKVKAEAEEAERARLEAERLRGEAQEAFAAELARVQAEVQQQLAVQIETARAEAERMREAEAEAARERAAAEAQLKAELDRLKFVAALTRKADESDTRKAAEQIKQLERELASVHAKAEERQVAQLEELRVQMAEMREAAAQNARAAAADAVAAEVARATAQSNQSTPARLNVIKMQPRFSPPVSVPVAGPVEEAPSDVAEESAASVKAGGDYYSLWQAEPPAAAEVEEPEEEVEKEPIDFRRYAKWALPIAACLLLAANTGTAITAVTSFVTPAEKPKLTVEPIVEAQPFSEVVKKRVGALRVESTPAGAEAIVDGRSYGKTPITIPELGVGSHTLVLKGAQGSVTRKVVIKPNETTALAEAIFSGWLAIFSPIPVTAVVDGQPVHLTEDGRLMTTPGPHVVELISERFNYRSTLKLEVKPGETTAHTVSLPMGSVRVTAPEGAEILVDGQRAVGVPSEGLSVAVGSHEITATHPELGERRAAVDVTSGALTEVTLRFDP
jgi:hypothetical protein